MLVLIGVFILVVLFWKSILSTIIGIALFIWALLGG